MIIGDKVLIEGTIEEISETKEGKYYSVAVVSKYGLIEVVKIHEKNIINEEKYLTS